MRAEHVFRGAALCWCGLPESRHRIRAYHQPEGDPCVHCRKPAAQHQARSYHKPQGNPCKVCGIPASKHVTDKARAARERRDAAREDRGFKSIIGVDGEGHDLPDGRHIYTLLSAVDESGTVVGEVENQKGLSAHEILPMLLALPKNALKFIFMGSYDWTKIIEDLTLNDIFYIMHPESRRARSCKKCQKQFGKDDTACPKCGHDQTRATTKLRYVSKDKHGTPLNVAFDWFNGSFTVRDLSMSRHSSDSEAPKARQTKVWDCFKFFQCSFVKAIKLWKIGTPEQWARIESMKSKRGAFDVEDPAEIRAYCREECMLLAQMMRQVLLACEGAGIKLKQYHGAGSIASALLNMHEVKRYLGPPLESLPKSLRHAVMSAYFGGRFENSVVGAVLEPVYNRDIFSAYPYALSRLPCLACGVWKRDKTGKLDKARSATLAVVRFRVKEASVSTRRAMAWAPLPCRSAEGSISFPTGFEGWAWMPEIEAALRGWPELIEVLECWTYTTECEHKPFGWIPAAYRRRFEWGKDGKGIVMKLGLNACAGKTMQNQGDPPPFKSWVLGGMITATTRSQSLDAICAAEDRWNVLAIATDGVFATEDLKLPEGANTGTGDLEKPLGNWGSEVHQDGVFFVKPGMYFDEAGSIMRARGIGREELNKRKGGLFQKFEDWDRESELKIEVNSRRFYGARSSVLMYSSCLVCKKSWAGWPEKGCPDCGQLGTGEAKVMSLPPHCRKCRRQKPENQPDCGPCPNGGECRWQGRETPAYGRWFPRKIVIEFACLPKREYIARRGPHGRMRIRDMGGIASVPYNPGQTTPEGEAARLATLEALEEPDWDDMDSEAPL